MVCLLDFHQMDQIVKQQLLFSDTRAAQTVILLLNQGMEGANWHINQFHSEYMSLA